MPGFFYALRKTGAGIARQARREDASQCVHRPCGSLFMIRYPTCRFDGKDRFRRLPDCRVSRRHACRPFRQSRKAGLTHSQMAIQITH